MPTMASDLPDSRIAELRAIAGTITDHAVAARLIAIANAFERGGGKANFSRQSRLNARDAEIRSALALYENSQSQGHVALASDLRRYVSNSWVRDKISGHPIAADKKRQALFKIVTLNHGRALCAKQIQSISRGHRGREKKKLAHVDVS